MIETLMTFANDSWLYLIQMKELLESFRETNQANIDIASSILLVLMAAGLVFYLNLKFHQTYFKKSFFVLAYLILSLLLIVFLPNSDILINVIGGIGAGFIVSFIADRIIKGGFYSQEQADKFSKGKEAYDSGEYNKAVKIWKELGLLSGHIDAQYELGKIFETGIKGDEKAEYIKKSKKDSEIWYSFAANQGHAGAQYKLGIIFKNRYEHKESYEWFKESIKRNWFLLRQGKLEKQDILNAWYNIGIASFYMKSECKTGRKEKPWDEVLNWLCTNLLPERIKLELGKGEMLKWHRKAGKQGHEASINCLKSNCVGKEKEKWEKRGDGKTDWDFSDSDLFLLHKADKATSKWIKSVAKKKKGCVEAQFMLAILYDNGFGTPQKAKKAFKWYKEAAKQNDERAQFSLGVMHSVGRGTDKNYEEEFKWFKKVAKRGDAEAQFNLGLIYSKGNDVIKKSNRKSMYWYCNAAEKNHTRALYNLGYMYDVGEGVDKDIIQAYKWYALCYVNGGTDVEGEAQNAFISLEINKGDVERAQKLVVEWIKKHKKQDDASVQYCLGYLYYFGNGVSKNCKKAQYLYRKAAEQGNADAQCALGGMYKYGNGVQQDYKKALEWYGKAAEQGHPESQFQIGTMYHEGKGVSKDYIEAWEWYEKAEEQWCSGTMNGLMGEYGRYLGPGEQLVELAKEMQNKGPKNAKIAISLIEQCKKLSHWQD